MALVLDDKYVYYYADENIFYRVSDLEYYSQEDLELLDLKKIPLVIYNRRFATENYQPSAKGAPIVVDLPPSSYHKWNREKERYELSEEDAKHWLEEEKEKTNQVLNFNLNQNVSLLKGNLLSNNFEKYCPNAHLKPNVTTLENLQRWLKEKNEEGIKNIAFAIGERYEVLRSFVEKIEAVDRLAPIAGVWVLAKAKTVINNSKTEEDIETLGKLQKFLYTEFLVEGIDLDVALSQCKQQVDELEKFRKEDQAENL